MQKNVITKFFTMIIATCLTQTFFTGCQQVVDEKTYYLNTYTVEFDANGEAAQ